MATATDLLNSLSTTDSEFEGHIVIGKDRKITVPDKLKRIAVQFDHDIETVTFDCPRYWDDHDMSKFTVYINYALGDGSTGCYIPKKVTVDDNNPEIMHFDWTISGNLTQEPSGIGFLVCAKKTRGPGLYEYIKKADNEDPWIKDFLDDNDIIAREPTGDYYEYAGEQHEIFKVINSSGVVLYVFAFGDIDSTIEVHLLSGPETVTNHWNSELCTDCYISKGLECEEHQSIEELYPDIVTNLLERMNVVEGYRDEIAGHRDRAEAILETVNRSEERVSDIYESASQINNSMNNSAAEIRNSYTNAIKGTAKGEIVRVNDVSPLEHDVVCFVHGKNLFDISQITSTSIATNNGDGSITIAANNYYCRLNQKLSEVCPGLKAGDVATLSFVSDSTTTQYMYFHGLQGTWSSGTTIKMTQEILDSYITIYGYAEGNVGYGQPCTISNIQIEKGSDVTEYEPYIDPTTVNVTRYGKNLFPVTPGSTNFGITLSKVGNYYVLNGTPTTSGLFITKIGYLPAGTYTVSANNPKHNNLGHLTVPIVQLYSPDTLSSVAALDKSVNSKATATIQAGGNYEVRIRYQENITYNNFIVKPQLEFGSTATEYEPYVEKQTMKPDTSGYCAVKSVNPSTTILVDKPGTTVEVEYNRDLEKIINNISSGGSGDGVGKKIAYVTLHGGNSWTMVEEDVYSQVVTVPGATNNSLININLNLEQHIAFRKKDITLFVGNNNGVITVYCVGQQPENDYTVQVSIVEVTVNE